MELTWHTVPFITAILVIGAILGVGIMVIVRSWDDGDDWLDDINDRVHLTLFQVREIRAFLGEDDDKTQVCLKFYDNARRLDDGEIMPRGLYVWLADHPEEGAMYLPEDEQEAEDYSAYQEMLEIKRHHASQQGAQACS